MKELTFILALFIGALIVVDYVEYLEIKDRIEQKQQSDPKNEVTEYLV